MNIIDATTNCWGLHGKVNFVECVFYVVVIITCHCGKHMNCCLELFDYLRSLTNVLALNVRE